MGRLSIDKHEIHDECGVFGVYDERAEEIGRLAFLALNALQHRGQHAAGMAISTGDYIHPMTNSGRVTKVFGEQGEYIDGLPQGMIVNAHVRYGTVEVRDEAAAAQPVCLTGERGENGHSERVRLTLGQNGHVINTSELAELYGIIPGSYQTDSELIAQAVLNRCLDEGEDLTEALRGVANDTVGSFSFVVSDETRLIGLRDPKGIRPLLLGQTANGGWSLASEKGAFSSIGARLIRDVEPGEMIVIDGQGPEGLRSEIVFPADEIDPRLCIFEHVYLSDPDNELDGISVQLARERMGEMLARQRMPRGDLNNSLVIGVPSSGDPAAIGFARASGIDYGSGFKRSRYAGRSFIAAEDRAGKVRAKLSVISQAVEGKNLYVVDDSLVRGTTMGIIVDMLRDAGANEVHVRISSPPITHPCFYGVDISTHNELLAAHKSVQQIKSEIGADSLIYLSLGRLEKAIGSTAFCKACMDGDYPTGTPLSLRPQLSKQS